MCLRLRLLTVPLPLLVASLHIQIHPAKAQSTDERFLIHLESDCTSCLTVDAEIGEFATLQIQDCQSARTPDKFWQIGGSNSNERDDSSDSISWCLNFAPNLCVEDGGDILLLSEATESQRISQYQRWSFPDLVGTTSSTTAIVGFSSGDCVTLSGGDGVQMGTCASTSNRDQRWQIDREEETTCLGDNNSSSGGDGSDQSNTDDSENNDNSNSGGDSSPTNDPDSEGVLIYLDFECTTCIGVDITMIGEQLVPVNCEETPASKTLWQLEYLAGSTIADSWCLKSDPDFCVVVSGTSLRLANYRSAEAFIINAEINDQIESVDSGQCVTRPDYVNILTLEECSSPDDPNPNKNQLWTKQKAAGRRCQFTKAPTPAPTPSPTRARPPSDDGESIPGWSIAVIVVGAIVLGVSVYFLAYKCIFPYCLN